MSKDETEGKFLYGQEQIDSLRKRINADSGRIMAEINAVTPIFAVEFVTKEGIGKSGIHFANFYGTTIEYEKGLSQSDIEAKVQENDAKIFEMLDVLENKIMSGEFKNVVRVSAKVTWAQFGGFMHKMNAQMEDALSCKTVETAFNKFQKKYADCKKTEKEILNERREQFERSLSAFSKSFLED